MSIRLTIETPEQMAGLGRRIARQLRAGDVVALDGELGAGKTTLTRGLGAELGVRGAVTSPTFVLARTHPRPAGGPPLVHVDAYRLGSAAELDDLDIDFAASIVVVEWAAGMLDALTDSVLSVRIDRPTGARLDPPRADVANTGHNDAEAGTGTEITGTEITGTAIDDADIDNSEIDDAVEARVVTITPRGERWRRHPFI